MKGPSSEVIIVGNLESEDTKVMLDELNKHYLPNKITIVASSSDNKIFELAPYAKDYSLIDDKAAAYVCQNYACNLPTSDPNTMIEQIKSI